MSELLTRITDDLKTARLARDTPRASALRVLIGEVQRSESKTTTDDDVKAIIEKFIKNNKIVLKHSPGDQQALYETSLLKSYLPPEVTEEEIRTLKAEMTTLNVGQFMALVQQYANTHSKVVDRELVARIFKE